MTRTKFFIRATENASDGFSLATSIWVDVPAGLTRQQAVDYVTGRVAGEVSRYFAHECLALGPTDNSTDYSEKIT